MIDKKHFTGGLNPWLKLLALAIYFGCLLVTAMFAYKRPHYNWDMLAYMALVVQRDHPGPGELHQLTYQAAKENIPAIDYANLLGGEHRKLLSEDATAFYNILPFYAVKPLYTELVYLFYKAGFSLPLSTVLPSICCYVLIGMLLYFWVSKYLDFYPAFIASLLVMLSNIMVFMARLSTPDCLAALFLLAAFYFILLKPSLHLLYGFLLLSIFARLDNIVAAIYIISFLHFSRKWQKQLPGKYYLLMVAGMLACYFGITFYAMRPFGWDPLYYPSFAKHLSLSHDANASFTWRAYLALVVSQLATAVVYYNFILFMLFVLLLLLPYTGRLQKFTFNQGFAALLVLIIATRFILYPDLSDRFNIAYYICFLLLFIKRYAALVRAEKSLPL